MNERTKFIGAWVSKEEKEEITKLAKAQNISISGLIRQSVIRPMMTLPDVAQSVKLHIDSKFRNLKNELKIQLLAREPIRRTIIEEYDTPIKRLRPPPSPPIMLTPEQKRMTDVISQLKKIIQGEEEYSFIKVQEEDINNRPKTDNLSYIEFKEEAMKRKPLFEKQKQIILNKI